MYSHSLFGNIHLMKKINVERNYKPPGHKTPDLPDYDLGDRHFPNGCPLCKSKVEFTDSLRFWGVDRGKVYICSNIECRASVGAHMRADMEFAPMGDLANSELRYLRRRVHLFFDVIWKELSEKKGFSLEKSRDLSYLWLSKQLKTDDVHVAQLTIAQCKSAVYHCRKLTKGGNILHKIGKGQSHTSGRGREDDGSIQSLSGKIPR